MLMLPYLSNGTEMNRNKKPYLPSGDLVQGGSKYKAFPGHVIVLMKGIDRRNMKLDGLSLIWAH